MKKHILDDRHITRGPLTLVPLASTDTEKGPEVPMDTTEKLRFFMDETSTPYTDSENPFVRTKEDDEFDKMIIEKYHLTTKERERDSF